MKKNYQVIFLSIIMLISMCFAVTGCKKKDNPSGKNKEYAVSFYVDDVLVKTVKSKGNEEIDFPEDPSKEGYFFAGWGCTFSNGYTEKYFTSEYYKNIPMGEDIKVFAQWKKKITIHFEMNGGYYQNHNEPGEIPTGPLPDEIICEGQKSLRINTVIEKANNAAFAGWYDNPELEGDRITDPYYPTESVTLYAAWVDEANVVTESGFKLSYYDGLGGYYTEGYFGEDVTELVIPSSYKGVPVVEIWSPFYFKDYQVFNRTITSIKTSKNLKVIKDNAFQLCSALTSVTISDTVEEIGDNAFDVNSLANITMGKNVKYIGANAFGNVNNYNAPAWAKSLPDGPVYLGNVFYGYKGTINGSFEIKSGTTAIAGNAFYGQNQMTSVTIPQGVEIIGRYAFGGCTQLKTINMPGTLTDIYAYAFYNCTSLESFVMPDSVTSIKDGIFSGCTSLKSVTLSENLTRLEYGMFENCPITELIVPEKVGFIGNAFTGNTTLQKITIKKAEIDFGELALDYVPDSITAIYVQENLIEAFKSQYPSHADKFFAIEK